MEKMLTWIRHNAPLAIGMAICIAVSIYAYGCESKGASILTPGARVTRAELIIEVKQIGARHEIELDKADLSLQQIEQEDSFKRRLFEFGMNAVQTGTVNPIGVLGLLGTIFGTSSYINGRKKDTIIARDRSAPGKSTT